MPNFVVSYTRMYLWTVTIPVDTGVLVGIVVPVGIPVGAGVIILHSTWEGSGLHLPSLPHVALQYDGTSPGC